MKPDRENEALVDLLDVILEKGVVLQADVVITVADVPLVGVSLRAAVAGMTTMTEYGYFEEWDLENRGQVLRQHRRPGSDVTGIADRPDASDSE